MSNEIVSENTSNSANTLAASGVRVEQTMTTPTRPGKKPRPVWVVSGNTFGLEPFFRDIGGKKFRGAWSFFNDPSGEISVELEKNRRSSFAEQVEHSLERKVAKAERYETYAGNAEERAKAASERASSIASMIPMGQPVILGHHSEKRHRRDRDRIDSGMRKSIEESKKADYFSHRVSSLQNHVARTRESRSYIGNRIEKATKELASLRRWIDETLCNSNQRDLQQRIQQAVEKLEYWQQQLLDLEAEITAKGGKIASPDTIKVGDEVYFHGWLPVVRVNRKTVTVSHWLGVPTLTYKLEYTKLKSYRSPDNL